MNNLLVIDEEERFEAKEVVGNKAREPVALGNSQDRRFFEVQFW